jgi:uncharacterized protein (TIGR03032 family)
LLPNKNGGSRFAHLAYKRERAAGHGGRSALTGVSHDANDPEKTLQAETEAGPEPAGPEPAGPPGIMVAMHGDMIAVLDRLGLSLALSTRPNHVVLMGARDGQPTLQATQIAQPMGLAAAGDRIAVALARTIVIFANVSRLAPHYPPRRGTYDAFFVPRTMRFTGECLMHDMVFSGKSIIGANTNFSCVCRVDGSFSFTPLWQPGFITTLRAEDRCHLNGFTGRDGQLRYVTTLSATDTEQGWRGQSDFAGTLIDVERNKLLRTDLCMPHSPRLVGDELYVLNGGKGELLRIDRETGNDTVVATLPGFTHGLCEHRGVLFVGLSQNRTSRKDNPPPIARTVDAMVAGVAAVEAASGRVLGMAEFTTGITEIYDVQPLPGIRHAGIQSLVADSGYIAVDTPGAAFWMQRKDEDQVHLLDALASGNYMVRRDE